ncbi:MAG: LTA synthase family protein [Janthinobacterium lividum]
MKNRLLLPVRYFLGWILFFELGRAAFLLYFANRAATLPLPTLLGTFGYGLRLDASFAAYLTILPTLAFMVAGLWGPRFPLGRVLAGYMAVVGPVVALLLDIDIGLYQVWGFRLDDTPLQYLNSPREMAATVGSAPVALLLLVLAGLLLAGYGLYRWLLMPVPTLPPGVGRGRAALAGALYGALLVVPLRGGVQQIPVNQSDVYFSAIPFANHAAVNPLWNLGDALKRQSTDAFPLPHFLPDSTAQRLVAELYPPQPASSNLLTEPRPNVLFIILESFTAKFVGSVGGEAGITPNLDSLARTGVVFTNVYAAGDRSQKGLVALLSGYPNQPTTSIIKYPKKTERLPHLCRSLRTVGYSSAYYYGGELAFANMQSYLRTAGYERLIGRSDFAARDQNSKWGAHDQVLFDRLLLDLGQQRAPFFVTAFTLSSHEPFEIPIPSRYPGTDETSLFRNSVWYTDWALGRFLRAARQQPWWAHTLVVLCADHGHPLPGNSATEAPAKFHIPLVLAGGALRPEARGQAQPVIGSQTDVATTLLRQLRLPTTDYRWGRDLLAPVATPFAYYCYENGFGAVGPAGTVTFDNVGKIVTSRSPGVLTQQLQRGQAYEQESLLDFTKR